jgi:hypothetical protein
MAHNIHIRNVNTQILESLAAPNERLERTLDPSYACVVEKKKQSGPISLTSLPATDVNG